MTFDEYVTALSEMDECAKLPLKQFEQYARANYERKVLLLRPSLFYTLIRRPWHFLCTPFNKLLNWVGEQMPLDYIDDNPTDDNYVHMSVMFRMAGFVPRQDYGWHVVDACRPSEMDCNKFRKYFRSQCRAIEGLPAGKAEEFLDALYSDYVEKNHIYEFGKYHRFTSKMRDKILNVIANAEPSKSYITKDTCAPEVYRANFNIDDSHYLVISISGPLALPEGAPKVIVRTSWTKLHDDNDVTKHQTWFNGDKIQWLTGKLDELELVYKAAHPDFLTHIAEA